MTKLPPSNTKQRLYGAYYTPIQVTEILTRWAVRSSTDTVLEPGFGGCGFLESAINRLRLLGNNDPTGNIFGCDRDSKAFSYLDQKIGNSNCANQFIHADFLGLTPQQFSNSRFDAVIGNPPYVSQHNMCIRQKESAQSAMKAANISLDKRSSLWAYFIVHALSFLNQEGRCAWVLPASFIHAQYSSKIKEIFQSNFRKLSIIHLTERLFVDSSAKEKTIILLADGYSQECKENTLVNYYARNTKELELIIEQDITKTTSKTRFLQSPISEAKTDDCFRKLISSKHKIKLSSAVEIKIGIVTGANRFFIIDEKTRLKNSIPKKHTKLILAKMSQARGLKITKDDQYRCIDENERCLLIDLQENDYNSGKLSEYLNQFPHNEKLNNKTFKKRRLWYRPCDGRIPDAFLSYMCDHGPRLMLNEASTNSTNTIHRCYIKDSFNLSLKLLSVAMLTSFSQLSAEINGRCYGSGVLKIEPSEARQIDILIPENLSDKDINTAYQNIHNKLKNKDIQGAQTEADIFIYSSLGIDAPNRTSEHLNEMLNKVRLERRVRKSQNSNQPKQRS